MIHDDPFLPFLPFAATLWSISCFFCFLILFFISFPFVSIRFHSVCFVSNLTNDWQSVTRYETRTNPQIPTDPIEHSNFSHHCVSLLLTREARPTCRFSPAAKNHLHNQTASRLWGLRNMETLDSLVDFLGSCRPRAWITIIGNEKMGKKPKMGDKTKRPKAKKKRKRKKKKGKKAKKAKGKKSFCPA